MQPGENYCFMTDKGALTLMIVDDTIVAYRKPDGAFVHHVPICNLSGSVHRDVSFRALYERGRTIVAGLFHPTDVVIAFYCPRLGADLEWGYVWNVDQPECSYWATTNRILASIDPDDLPISLKHVSLAYRIRHLACETVDYSPRAVALAVRGGNSLPYEVLELDDLQKWLDQYLSARVDASRLVEDW